MTAPAATALRSDGGRARLPDATGIATAADGVRLAWGSFGAGDPTILLVPSTPIVHARQWKGQIHDLSRRSRVLTYDGRGNGRSDRPTDPAAYDPARLADDALAVLDATGTESAVLVGLCVDGVWPAIQVAAAHPERVRGIVAFAIGVPLLTPSHPHYRQWPFDEPLDTDEGWAKLNRHYWQRDYPGFARFFFDAICREPHSTKVVEDAVGWAVDGSVEAMLADAAAPHGLTREGVEATCRAVRCPMLAVHGTQDHCQPVARAQRFAELTGARVVLVEGADHLIPGRHPVLANLLVREFVEGLPGRAP